MEIRIHINEQKFDTDESKELDKNTIPRKATMCK